MNSTPNFPTNLRARLNWVLSALVVAFNVSARAETQPASIPFSHIGAGAAANCRGDAVGIAAASDGARLRCGLQKIEGRATTKGLWLESAGLGAAGKLRLVAAALRRDRGSTAESQASTALSATGTVSVQDKVVRFTRPGLTEEYSVSADGVQQDFVIAVRPAGAGDLCVDLALAGARAEAAAGGVRVRLEGSGRTLAYSRLRVEDATGRELTARLEVLSSDRLAINVADANATYPVRIDPTFSDADWVILSSGINGSVAALAVSGTNLYAGGTFTNGGGMPGNYVAKWHGSAWSALDSGIGVTLNSIVSALAMSGTDLYAAGWFAAAGGVPATNIAQWDGTTWSALGLGITSPSMPAHVSALAVNGTDLYAGGWFGMAGGVPANNIAQWDGSAWSALGSGLNAPVFALVATGTSLFAGGEFNTAGGATVSNIAQWDGSAWSALGSGIHGPVYALAVSGTNLYAGGWFDMAGGVPANNIAKWDGSTWSALGLGLGGSVPNVHVYALAVSGTDLYAGGDFTNAGGVPANHIAKWDGSAWSALGSGMSGEVNALAADGAGHLFVGGAGGVAQANLPSVPALVTSPQTQTAEAGATVHLWVEATGQPPPAYQWCQNGTNILSCAGNELVLTNIPFARSGTYIVVVTNVFGAVTSAPVTLNVIAPVARRWVPGVNLTAQAGNFLGLDYRDTLGPAANWQTMATMTLCNASQYYFDVSEPLPPQRFYRAWQTGTPAVAPSLDLKTVPAITLTGSIGDSLRLDYINQFGPTDAWVTLATVTLTNTSQLYFDTSRLGQPARLWRIVPVP